MKTTPKTWNPTKHKHLYRHKSGVYYARLSVAGKKTWRSLKTSTLGVAVPLLEELLKDASHAREISQDTQVNVRITGADAIAYRKVELQNDPSIKKRTRAYYNEIIAYIERSWPEFLKKELRNVNEEACQRWVGENKDSMSPTRFNNALSMIRSLFEIAIKKGARRTNPTKELHRMKVRTKDLSRLLPDLRVFKEWVTVIREAGGRFSRPCADFVEFLAFTGVRTGEAQWVRWQHCNFSKGEILIVGDPEEGTKNSEFRRVPMIQDARALLLRMKADRQSEDPKTPVLLVNEAQKAMDRAFVKLGMERFTHHDLRHYFATICIESGVDIPTVARWLGHKDGGALAMKVYGHLRNEHSLEAAKKVSFAA